MFVLGSLFMNTTMFFIEKELKDLNYLFTFKLFITFIYVSLYPKVSFKNDT